MQAAPLYLLAIVPLRTKAAISSYPHPTIGTGALYAATSPSIDYRRTLFHGQAKAIETNEWYKVVLHGVPTKPFNTPTGLIDMKTEIETYNRGLKVAGVPIWLTSKDKRDLQQGATVLVGFETEAEANRATQNRLFVGAESVRVEKAKPARTKERAKPNNSPC